MGLELHDKVGSEPRTDEEARYADLMSDVDFGIFRHKLETISAEGKHVMAKLGVSTPLRSEDSGSGIYTAKGDMASSAAGVYYHSLTGQIPIKYTVMKWANEETVGINDGDIFYVTDPIYGATHTPDQICFMPVIWEGDLLAWVTCVAHQAEVGAIEPSLSARASNAWSDGMRILPMKIGENLRVREDILAMLGNMTRAPQELALDIKARVAGVTRMRERLLQLVGDIGKEKFVGALRRCIDDGRLMVKRRLEGFNDGTYRCTLFLDGVGGDIGLVRISCAMTKRGDRLTLDLTGTSPQTPYAFNAYKSMAHGAFANPMFSYLMSDVPPSIGLLDQAEFIQPEGTVLSASADAAVACSLWPTFIFQAASHVCLMKMAFDGSEKNKIAASQSPNALGGYAVGLNQHGVIAADLYVDPVNGSGSGGRATSDGVDVFTGIWGNYMDTGDAEEVEQRLPYFKLYSRIAKDAHGYGKYRGGSGPDTAYVAHNPPGWLDHATMGFESKVSCTPGLFGGYYGNVTPGLFIKGSNLKKLMKEDQFTIPESSQLMVSEHSVSGEYMIDYATYPHISLQDGDVWMMLGPGGGGYGDVLDRDPQLVIKDLRENVISDWVAKEIYRVAYDEETLFVDEERTRQLRDELREERKSTAKPYGEFIREWSAKRPPEVALKYFGEWPGEMA